MRYIKFIILTIIMLTQVCYAEETSNFIKELRGHLEYNENIENYNPNYIYLKPDSRNFINISQPQNFSSNSLNLHKGNFDIYDSKIQSASTFTGQEYAIKSVYGRLSESYGKFTIGTLYDSFIDDAENVYMTGVYTRIDGKHTALTITARTETGNSYSYYSDKIVIAPELKLTKRLSLLDVAQTDLKQSVQKNEIVLRYNPKIKNHTDDIFLEIGAGNTFREQDYVKSSIRFSTRFKL